MSAGKGDTPRPVNGEKFRDNYEAAFRKAKWPHDDNPFESADHDNDSSVYDEAVSRAYGGRNNLITAMCEAHGELHALKSKLEQYQRHTETLITLLEIQEVSEDGLIFSPNTIRSCRTGDLAKINESIIHLKMLNDET
jgi:hypothetical protein